MKKPCLYLFLLVFAVAKLSGQVASHNQSASLRSGGNHVNFSKSLSERPKAFIENKGQLDFIEELKGKQVLYDFNDEKSMRVFFTSKGLVYVVYKEEEASEREWERAQKGSKSFKEEEEEKEKEKEHILMKSKIVEMSWENANPEVETSASDPVSNYYNYYMPEIDKDKVIGNVKGYTKLLYKDIYPKIDVEFAIHPKEGIKYSYILHPGADPSLIKMSYSGANLKKDKEGNIIISTALGDITDHAPLTYTGLESSGRVVESQFALLDKNTVGFKLAGNTITETTVIDPWQVGPTFPVTKFTPNDVAVDGSGNVLVYSMKPHTTPVTTAHQRIDKYNSAGVFQWTFDLTANAAYKNDDQGDVKADPSGNVYVSIGIGLTATTYYNTIKINPSGTALLWGTSGAGLSSNQMFETWTITFNCDYSQFYQSGGGRLIAGTVYYNVSVEEPVNAATGTEGTIVENDTLGEIIDTYWAPNGLVYHMTADSNLCACRTGSAATGAHNNLICINPATGVRLFKVPTGYSYADGDNKAPYSVGINGIAGGQGPYLYTMNGAKLDRWDISTGAHYNQVSITGGSTTANSVNSGILTNKCGHVFVGGVGKIYEYDATLNLLNTITLPINGIVFDMAWADTSNSAIVACGGNADASTFLANVSVNSCVIPFGYGVTVAATQPAGCGGTGSATATATFGGAPYTYSWSPGGQTTQTVSGLNPGTYTVTVSSTQNCPYKYVVQQTVTINAGSGGLSSTESHANLSCNSVCAGTGTVTPSGGTGPYTYTWSPSGGNAASASGLCANTYSVTIRDNTGCATTQTVAITEPTAVSAVLTSTSTCTGLCNGSTSVTASGGTPGPGYTYTWSPSGGNASSASSLCAGNYTVTVKDNNNCAVTSTVAVAPIANPTVAVNPATICAGASATLTASGATTYSWSPSTGLSGTTGSVVTATPGSSTTYTVTGTTSGCSGTNTSAVTVNPNPTVTATSATICSGSSATLTASGATSFSWTPATGLSATTGSAVTANPSSSETYTVTGTTSGCSGSNTAVLTVNPTPTVNVNSSTICPGTSTSLSASGGTTYSWTPGTGLSSTTGATVTANPTVTTTYTVEGTSNGCTGTTTSTVTVVNSLTVSVNSAVICSGTSVTLNATGASTYSWSPATGLSSTSGASVVANPSGNTTYTVVGSAGSCSATATSTVTVNTTPTVSPSGSPTVICSGSSSVLSASGATSYTWSANAGGGGATTVTVSPTSNTTYTLVGDDNGCLDSSTVTINVTPLPSLTVTATPTAICSGQTTTLTASGASTFTWSANAGSAVTGSVSISPTTTDTYTVTGDNSGCTSSETVAVNVTPTPTLTVGANPVTICAGNTSTLSVSGATSYTWSANAGGVSTTTVEVTPSSTTVYTVTGENSGCTDVDTVSVSVTPLPTLTVTSNPPGICSGQTATLTAAGATSFTWSANAGSVVGATTTVSPTSATDYTVTGTQNGCDNISIITVFVTPTPTVAISAAPQNTVCAGQSVTLSATGATNYTWSPGNQGGTSIVVSPTVTTTYTLSGDNGGCADSDTITVNINPLPTLTITPSPVNICSGQTATLTVSGATSYTWSANAGSVTTNTVSVSPANTDTYTVTGDDGCVNTQTVVVNVTTTPTITTVASPSVICSGQSSILSGTGAQSYTWSANAGGVMNDSSTVSPSTGTITYTLVGANGNCKDSSMVTLTVNPTPTVSINSSANPICSGQTATLTASGAGALGTYTWTPTSTVNDSLVVSPSAPTVYTVNATMGNCPGVAVYTLQVNPTPTLTPVSSQTVCSGAPVLGTTFTVNPAGVNIAWANSNTGIGLGANGVGNIPGYTAPAVTTQQTGTVTVLAANAVTGCNSTGTFVIIINPAPSVAGDGLDSALCSQSNGGVTGIHITGGMPGYSVQWFNATGPISNATDTLLNGVPAGVYTVHVQDQNGCVAGGQLSFTVPGSTQPTASFVPSVIQGQAPLNVSYTNTSINATSYNWNLGNSTSASTLNAASTYTTVGIYTVTLTAMNAGCADTYTVQIVVDAASSIVIPNIFSPNGDGINEEFQIRTTGMSTLECDIYNRWGQKIYTLGSPNAKWDGSLDNGNHAVEGTYYYIYEAHGYDGKTYSGKGFLTLVK